MLPCAYSSIVPGHDKTNPLNSAVWCRLFNLKLYCDVNQGRETDRDGKIGNLLGDNVTPPSLPSAALQWRSSPCVWERAEPRGAAASEDDVTESSPLLLLLLLLLDREVSSRTPALTCERCLRAHTPFLSLSLSLDSHFSHLSVCLACNLSSPASLSLYFYLSSPWSHSLSHSITHTHTHILVWGCAALPCALSYGSVWLKLEAPERIEGGHQAVARSLLDSSRSM